MNYNHNPDWAKIKIHPWCKVMSACPNCEQDNFEQFKERLYGLAPIDLLYRQDETLAWLGHRAFFYLALPTSYYKASHALPLIAVNCPKCGADYEISTEIRIFPTFVSG